MLLVYVYSGKCPADKLCLNCEDEVCKECQGGYLDKAEGVCVEPESSISNCLSYSNKDKCSFCEFGFFLEANGCTEIKVDGCAIAFADVDSCVACKDGVKLVDGKCDASNTCDEENCGLCAAGVCLLCKKGFSLTNLSKCVEAPIENCAETTADNQGCAICDIGYYDTNEACLKHIPILRALTVLLGLILM